MSACTCLYLVEVELTRINAAPRNDHLPRAFCILVDAKVAVAYDDKLLSGDVKLLESFGSQPLADALWSRMARQPCRASPRTVSYIRVEASGVPA